ncbi:MAG: thiamine-phosphate pyrophosphorylase [Candidatus Omnitrophica bacterium]|nr:thiamine-phosphate pyrophosphorylase [Candidatus Omnitrophota bacterium]
MKNPYLRIFDANFNRAKEALRVAEDFSRFLLNQKSLSLAFKKCRHDLSQIVLRGPLPYRRLVLSRDSIRDVGRAHAIRDLSKADWKQIMAANLKRAEEALRVLEELSKVLMPKASSRLEALRFRVYELERQSFQKF